MIDTSTGKKRRGAQPGDRRAAKPDEEKKQKSLYVRFTKEDVERIDAVLTPYEKSSNLIREATLKEVALREWGKSQELGQQ